MEASAHASSTGEGIRHLLVFGASGSIGGAIRSAAAARGWKVTGVARSTAEGVDVLLDPFGGAGTQPLLQYAPFDAVCWAQGANLNDSVYDVNLEEHLNVYKANVVYILATMKMLLDEDLLAPAAKLCIVSSIWQNLARQNKLSYGMSKAALQGLVLSASADLARDGHLINAILPGALETPMTRKHLSAEQIDRLSQATGFHRLASLEDVANLACFLCSAENTGVTGQFIAADLGFSHVRLL